MPTVSFVEGGASASDSIEKARGERVFALLRDEDRTKPGSRRCAAVSTQELIEAFDRKDLGEPAG